MRGRSCRLGMLGISKHPLRTVISVTFVSARYANRPIALELENQGKWRRERDSNPRYGFPYTRVPGVRLKPLGHLSAAGPSGGPAQQAFRRSLCGKAMGPATHQGSAKPGRPGPQVAQYTDDAAKFKHSSVPCRAFQHGRANTAGNGRKSRRKHWVLPAEAGGRALARAPGARS